jgi:hypothetical protein
VNENEGKIYQTTYMVYHNPVGYLFSVRPVLNFLMTKAKEQGETALLVSMREHAQNDLFWNFTGTPTPLDELWPIK